MRTVQQVEDAGAPYLANLDTLREPGERRRLSAPALRLFFRLAEVWDLSMEQQRALLGEVSRQTYYNWKAGRGLALGRDQIERVSLTLGILKGLRQIFADEMAGVRWLKAANSDLPFGGKPPLDRMTAGGVGGLHEVRRYLEAWRGVK